MSPLPKSVPGLVKTLLTIGKKLGNRLLKPSSKENELLNDHFFRQTNIFSKTNNRFFIVNGDKQKNFVGDINKIPEEILKLLNKQFNKPWELKKDDPTINLISSVFQKDMKEYIRYFFKEDENLLDQIYPFFDPKYKSILKLSTYVKELFEKNEDRRAQKIKDDIGFQYGQDGRKLCNLYTMGYIDNILNEYIGKIFEKAEDKKVIGIRLNDLMDTIIKFSEGVFFINQHTTGKNKVVSQINRLMQLNRAYLAIHSAGSQNIQLATDIIEELEKQKIFQKYGYTHKQRRAESTSLCPFFDVIIKKKRKKRKEDTEDEE